MQDRNGTMWLFWQRKIYYTSLAFYYVLFSKYSYNSGASWSTETQMTRTATNVDSMMPFPVQSTYNKSIWLFYTTNPFSSEDIYALISSPISPIHDVTIAAVTPSWPIEFAGGLASIGQSPIISFNVTVLNLGDQSEIVTVSLSVYNSSSYSLGTKQNLAVPGGTVNLVFNWNATIAKLGFYSAVAYVAPVPGETIPNQADNNITYTRNVRVIPWADIDQDGIVSLGDVSVFFYDFGFTAATPSRWTPLADIANHGIIDIVNVGIAVKNFGIVS
jgi:hypothetical protein